MVKFKDPNFSLELYKLRIYRCVRPRAATSPKPFTYDELSFCVVEAGIRQSTIRFRPSEANDNSRTQCLFLCVGRSYHLPEVFISMFATHFIAHVEHANMLLYAGAFEDSVHEVVKRRY